jgi:Domain of unknown function (DUF4276)
VEGGGEGEVLGSVFQQGWRAFFESAGLGGRLPRVVRGKSRNEAFNDFCTAVAHPRSNVLPLLLVDSEEPVAPNHSPWQHLKARDGWTQPNESSDDHAFLMVQVTETWFLADRELLRKYFGQEFREHHIKKWPSLENVPKPDVFRALDMATKDCPKPYSKGKVCFEILGRLNPDRVEKACPSAKRLLDRLRSL